MSEKPPIVVLGANHTGTRLIVDILEALGSDSGRANNRWREEETFLSLHKDLVRRVSSKNWTDTIYDAQFVESFEDDGSHVEYMRAWLHNHLDKSFPPPRTHTWHWKCPTAVMFLPSWLQIYPDAHYLHIERDEAAVAKSLVGRRKFVSFAKAERFYRLMNERILREAASMRLYTRLAYEDLPDGIPTLIAELALDPSAAQIEKAIDAIHQPTRHRWRKERSIPRNIWDRLTDWRAALRS